MELARRLARPLAVAVAVGVVDGLVFLGFEWVDKHGTDWLWNDVAGSDDVRWRVIPVAIVLSLALSLLLRALREPRWTPPHMNPVAATDEAPPATLEAVGIILLIGGASLLAGASLGPEAPLVGAATGLGAWAAARPGAEGTGQSLVLASAGALLVAFFGSLIPLVIPLLIIRKRAGRLAPLPVAVVVVAGLAAWGTLWAVQGDDDGFGGIPSAGVHARDYLAAVVLGVLAVGLGIALRWVVMHLADITERIAGRLHWGLAAAVFGLGLGLLYLLGGPTVQFSGNEGIGMLLSGERQYGTWALAGIVVVKLLVTSWSLSAGYRGGLVFPSVFAGLALSLFVAGALPDLAGPGVLLGSVAGLFVEMTTPAVGAIMLLALLPAKLLPLGLAGAAGAAGGRALLRRSSTTRPSS